MREEPDRSAGQGIEAVTAAALLEKRLSEARGPGRALLLDGGLGTELERHGVDCGLPLWSARALLEAPEALARVHAEYAAAGAEIVTANTYRTQTRVLRRARDQGERVDADARALTRRALALAREAVGPCGRRVLVAGSAATLEDCYRPDLVPEAAELAREHAEHAENLAEAGAELILIETINSVREGVAAARAAAATGLPFAISFVSWKEAALLSGEPLCEAIARASEYGPSIVAVNCLPPSSVPSCLPALQGLPLPFGIYANLGAPAEGEAHTSREEWQSPDEFAALAEKWIAAGASLVGGCCGTTPDHIRAIALAQKPKRG